MCFETLFNKVSPRLKVMAKGYKNRLGFINEDDFYQEMCIYLWNKFKEGVPKGINEAYIVKGCRFFILNYFRKNQNKARVLSFEIPIDDKGNTLGDLFPDTKESLKDCLNRKFDIEDNRRNLNKRENQVFTLLLDGYTVREAGKRLGVSHVMVIKIKKKIAEKLKIEF